MTVPEKFETGPQEPELTQTIYIVDEQAIVPTIPAEREVFVVRIPEGMDLEAEREAYETCGGQIRHFGEVVDIKTVSFGKWLTAKGAEISYDSDLTQTS